MVFTRREPNIRFKVRMRHLNEADGRSRPFQIEVVIRADFGLNRCDALSADRMAQARTRSECLADRTSGDEVEDREVGG